VEQDRKPLDLAGLVKKLKYVTLAVQLMPFVYTVPYLITLIITSKAPEPIVVLFDTLFYVSPIVVVGLLILSRLLRLCRWHKTACILPLLPQVVSFVDYYVIELTEVAAQVNIILFGSMSVFLLFAAYNVFMK
jgi:hypothetical protein